MKYSCLNGLTVFLDTLYLHIYYSGTKRSRLIYIYIYITMYLQQYRMVSGGQRKSIIYDSFRDSLFSENMESRD